MRFFSEQISRIGHHIAGTNNAFFRDAFPPEMRHGRIGGGKTQFSKMISKYPVLLFRRAGIYDLLDELWARRAEDAEASSLPPPEPARDRTR